MWEKDRLNRKEFADFLCTLIRNSDRYKRTEEEQAYVIALDSPWGTGKSWFLEIFEQYLRETEDTSGIRVIHYSAWSNDFWDNAFLPLLYALYKHKMLNIEAAAEKSRNCARDILRLAAYLGKEAGFKKLETVLGENVVKTLSEGVDQVWERPEQGVASIFQDYEEFCQAYDSIKRMLSDYQKTLEEQEKILIVVDELDRCRPDFAVQTLEVVKHLFNVDGLVFLFAVDMEQLGCVIRGIYGESLDARNYLNRMFNYITHLPTPDSGKYFRMLLEEKRESFQEVYQNDQDITMVSGFVQCLTDGFELSLRELDTIWKNYHILYDYRLKHYRMPEAHMVYLMFLVLKYRVPNLEAYMREHEYFRLEELPMLRGCEEYLTAQSPVYHLITQYALTKIRNLSGWIGGQNPLGYRKAEGIIERVENGFVFFENQSLEIVSKSYFAGILYEPDFVNWEWIKEKSVIDFMKEQLELFEFNGE